MKDGFKRDSGLDKLFLPFDIAAAVIAALLVFKWGMNGFVSALAFVGCWIGLFLVLVIAFYLVVLLISFTIDMKKPAPKKDPPFFRAIVLYIIGQLCRFARVRVYVKGEDRLPEGRFLLVSNHRSAYDPISSVWALRKHTLSIVSKPENLRIIMVGPMLYKTNFLSINRDDPREAMKTIQAAASLIKDDVVSVGIYPEGTRNREPEKGLLPFHNGVFKIAQKADAPLVVATIKGTEKIGKNIPWRHTDVFLNICTVISPEELKGSTASVSEKVRGIMEADLDSK